MRGQQYPMTHRDNVSRLPQSRHSHRPYWKLSCGGKRASNLLKQKILPSSWPSWGRSFWYRKAKIANRTRKDTAATMFSSHVVSVFTPMTSSQHLPSLLLAQLPRIKFRKHLSFPFFLPEEPWRVPSSFICCCLAYSGDPLLYPSPGSLSCLTVGIPDDAFAVSAPLTPRAASAGVLLSWRPTPSGGDGSAAAARATSRGSALYCIGGSGVRSEFAELLMFSCLQN